jgi:hypothetical protein
MGARDLPDDYARAAALVSALFAEFMRPPANLTVSQWPIHLEFINTTLAYVWRQFHISDAAQSSKGIDYVSKQLE